MTRQAGFVNTSFVTNYNFSSCAPSNGILVGVFAMRPSKRPVGRSIEQVVFLLEAEPRILKASKRLDRLQLTESTEEGPPQFLLLGAWPGRMIADCALEASGGACVRHSGRQGGNMLTRGGRG